MCSIVQRQRQARLAECHLRRRASPSVTRLSHAYGHKCCGRPLCMGKAKTTPKWRSRDLTHRDAAALPTTSAAIMPLELQPRHAALPRRTQTRCRREAGEAASERGRRVAPMAARVSTAQLHLRLAALVARSRHHAHKSSSVRPSAVSARALRSCLLASGSPRVTDFISSASAHGTFDLSKGTSVGRRPMHVAA